MRSISNADYAVIFLFPYQAVFMYPIVYRIMGNETEIYPYR